MRSLGTAEAKRINQLLYCVRLRAMIMPLRYEILQSVESISSKPRQHVPPYFADPNTGDAYLQYLLRKAAEVHTHFVEALQRIVETFNRAKRPSDLNLDSTRYPYQIWREASHLEGSSHSRKRLDRPPHIGEILYVLPDAADGSRISVGNYAYFLDFADDGVLVQLSGTPKFVVIRVRARRQILAVVDPRKHTAATRVGVRDRQCVGM